MKIADIKGTHTPLQIMQKVPWDKIKNCIVIYEDDEGNSILNISEMTWKDRVWLTQALTNYNVAEQVTDLLSRRT